MIILDEAQNTTASQMLMFLTRMGHGSKMIVTGDDSQIDLPEGTVSGLADAQRRLSGIKGIAFVRLDRAQTSSATTWCRTSSRRTRGTSEGPRAEETA